MSKTPYRIKRAEHPVELQGAVAAEQTAWRESFAGLVPEDLLQERTSEDFVEMRLHEWALASQEGTWFWVLMDSRDARVVGVAHAVPRRELDGPELLELAGIHLTEEVKGSGAADRLLEMAIGDMACYAWVPQGADRAVRFLERNGFVADGAVRPSPEYGVEEQRLVRREAE